MMSHVCIYGMHTAGLVRGEIYGGQELQMWLVANALAASGIEVTIVDPVASADLFPAPRLAIRHVPGWNGGMRGLRYFTRRVPALARVLAGTDASVYYARGISSYAWVPMRIAHRLKRPFLFAVAHDVELLGWKERFGQTYRK